MGDSKRLKQGHGNWVVGEQFWDRETDIDSFIELIDEKAHLLLVAQRRMGKTSLMREVQRRLEDRYLCLFVDLQKAKNGPDAIVELTPRHSASCLSVGKGTGDLRQHHQQNLELSREG